MFMVSLIFKEVSVSCLLKPHFKGRIQLFESLFLVLSCHLAEWQVFVLVVLMFLL